jgi:mannose-6-phosphate isomerase-like protein (cupin superfamily)
MRCAARAKAYGGGREVALDPGYTVFVPPMEEHQFTKVAEEPPLLHCLTTVLGAI